MPRSVELDVVRGEPELVEVPAHRRGGNPLVAEVRDRRVPVTLRELLAVGAEQEAVVDHLWQLAADRLRDAPLQPLVGSMVGAADDVRDPEVEVVGDGCELVRRAFRPLAAASRRRGGATRRDRGPPLPSSPPRSAAAS